MTVYASFSRKIEEISEDKFATYLVHRLYSTFSAVCRFTAMRIAVVTCKVKPPSSDLSSLADQTTIQYQYSNSNGMVTPTGAFDFTDELQHLMAKYGKTPQEVCNLLHGQSSASSKGSSS